MELENTDQYLNQSGTLDVGYHQIYWEDWGNKNATPIMFLHGGPGGGYSRNYRKLFNPEQHRVIFHNQRGSGKSTPYADTHENTTPDLITDIERIREHLGIEKMHVTGGSWGSALSLFYTIAHPTRVERLVIWSVFVGSQFEVDFVNEGYPRHYFPEAWERFIALVPEEHRKDGDSVMRFYAEKIRSEDTLTARKYADEWTLWETSLCSINYNKEDLEEEIMGDEENLSIAHLETHYFLNKSFVPENHVINNLNRIQHIPCTAIQGRFDMCTPPISVYELAKLYGENMNLKWVNCGHMSSDELMREELIQTFNQDF